MSKLKDNISSSLNNTGNKMLTRFLPVEEIKTMPELENIFVRQDSVYSQIVESMQREGFKTEEPIVIAKDPEGNVLGIADGNTRFRAAVEAGIDEIPVMFRTFETLEDAKGYAVDRQLKRRNLSSAEIYKYATANLAEMGKTISELAEDLGTSKSTINHARTVEKYADEETKEAVRNNEESIDSAYQKVRKQKKKEQDEFSSEDDEAQEENGDDGLTDSVSDGNRGSGGGMPFAISDGVERPHHDPWESSDYDRRLTERYTEGYSDGFTKAMNYILGEVIKGKTPKEIYDSPLLSDLTGFVLVKQEFPPENEELVLQLV